MHLRAALQGWPLAWFGCSTQASGGSRVRYAGPQCAGWVWSRVHCTSSQKIFDVARSLTLLIGCSSCASTKGISSHSLTRLSTSTSPRRYSHDSSLVARHEVAPSIAEGTRLSGLAIKKRGSWLEVEMQWVETPVFPSQEFVDSRAIHPANLEMQTALTSKIPVRLWSLVRSHGACVMLLCAFRHTVSYVPE
jgi:hypothetical protein